MLIKVNLKSHILNTSPNSNWLSSYSNTNIFIFLVCYHQFQYVHLNKQFVTVFYVPFNKYAFVYKCYCSLPTTMRLYRRISIRTLVRNCLHMQKVNVGEILSIWVPCGYRRLFINEILFLQTVPLCPYSFFYWKP